MASRVELEDKSNEIVRILEGDSPLAPEEITGSDHEEATVYVHPGFADYSGFLRNTIGLGRNDYQRYLEDLSESRHESARTGSPAAVLYPKDFREETEKFIKEIAEPETLEFIPTYSQPKPFLGTNTDARPVTHHDEQGTFSGEAYYAGLIDSLDEGGTLALYGELSNQCYSDAVLIAEKVEEEIEKDFTVEKRSSFPEKRFVPMPVRNVSLNFI